MSKMSQLHAALTAQAAELGFQSIKEAEANGFTIDYDNETFVRVGLGDQAQEEVLNPLGYSTVDEAIADGWDSAEWLAARESEQEKAHEAWLKEKEDILIELKGLHSKFEENGEYVYANIINDAIQFIRGVSHE